MNFKFYIRLLIIVCFTIPLNSSTSTAPQNNTYLDDETYAINILNYYTNHTYMFVRPVFNSLSFQQSSWHHALYHKQKNGFAAQIGGIYEQSYSNLYNPAYFFFDFKNELTISAGTPSTFNPLTATSTTSGGTTTSSSNPQFSVKNPLIGQINVPSGNRDVLGQWVGITKSTDQDLKITLDPQQEQMCLFLEVSQDLNRIFQSDLFENWFINVALPITLVRNNIGITGDQKAVNAFGQTAFNYIRMSPNTHESFRVTQAIISLGTRYMSQDDIEIFMTSGVLVPLVEQSCDSYLFSPVQGYNSHFGFNTEVHFQFPLIYEKNNPSRILFFADVQNIFLARNHQLRTYDIRNRPFSRYMQLLDSYTNQLVPAMNVLTIRSRVEPYNVVNFMTGFRFAHHNCYGEIGYELWAHGTERITPEPKVTHREGWFDNYRYGIPFINADGVLAKVNPETGVVEAINTNIENGLTSSLSTINYVASPDGDYECCPSPSFIPSNQYIAIKDLEIYTAGSRSTITHKGFFSVGLGKDGEKRNYFVNFGAFIEASQNNAALNFWGGWFKGGFTF